MVNKIVCSFGGGCFKGMLMKRHGNNGRDLLKAKINLLLKK